jgi:hypothetical protein
VDLQIALGVAKAFNTATHVRRQRLAAQETLIELPGADRADHAMFGGKRAGVRKPHAAGASLLIEDDGIGVGTGLNAAALIGDQRFERRQQFVGATGDDRTAGSFDRKADHVGHRGPIGALRIEPGMQQPRREQGARHLGPI